MNKATVNALLWKLCTKKMKAKIASRTDYVHIQNNVFKLFESIKQHSMSYESTQYLMKTILDALKNYVNLKQRDDESHLDYMKRFKAAEEVFYSHVGVDFHFPKLLEADRDYNDVVQKMQVAFGAGNPGEVSNCQKKMKILQK